MLKDTTEFQYHYKNLSEVWRVGSIFRSTYFSPREPLPWVTHNNLCLQLQVIPLLSILSMKTQVAVTQTDKDK